MENQILQRALQKAENYCARAEKCVSEVENKLYDWGFPAEIHQEVIRHLIDEKFIDQTRYAIAFARDKFRFNKWGKIKIRAMLSQKRIADADISLALLEIPEKEYDEMAVNLLENKLLEIKRKEPDSYKQKSKLFSFAQSRGIENKYINRLEALF